MAVSALDNTIPNAQIFGALSSSCDNLACIQITEAILHENAQLRSALVQALSENQSLKEQLKEAQRSLQELYEKANLGSDTSGIPTSKDWKNNGAVLKLDNQDNPEGAEPEMETPIAVTDYIRGNEEKKRRGGQPNHPPNSMRFSSDVQKTNKIPCYPGKCVNCPYLDQCIEEGRVRQYNTAYGYDIEVVLIKNEYQMFESKGCLLNEPSIRGESPLVVGSQFYDMNIQLHVLTWHHLFRGSYERISLTAKELFGLSLGAGTANTIYHRISIKILASRFMDALRFHILLFVSVLGLDETSARVAGLNAWVHTAVADDVTLLTAHWRRGYEGAIYSGLLQFFLNTIITDCWSAYFNGDVKAIHAVCCCHILRELVAAAYFRYQNWAIEMFDLLLELLNDKRDAVERGEKSFAREYLDAIRERYHRIVTDGYIEINGEIKGKTFALLERLKKLEDSVLAFAVDFDVKFTNNASEQSLRDLKVALSVIGQFKSMSGLADYCIVQSFMDTCRKQGYNPFDMLKILLSGGDIIESVFGMDKAGPIKQMIRLSDAFASGDDDEINASKADITFELTDNLLQAASFDHYRVCDDLPPQNKKASAVVPKDKMQTARERNLVKVTLQTAVASSKALPKKQMARAAPHDA